MTPRPPRDLIGVDAPTLVTLQCPWCHERDAAVGRAGASSARRARFWALHVLCQPQPFDVVTLEIARA